MNEIAQALERLFDRHRIIFWYDAKRELRAEYEAVNLPGVEKVELRNNEFGLKYRLLRQEPEQKFLLYRDGPPPADLDNWLLDVQLAQGEFHADQIGLWLHDLGLGVEFTDVAAGHIDFFKSAARRAALKALLQPDDTPGQIRLKMTAVCAGAEPRLDDILEHLLADLAAGRDEKERLIERCNLTTFLWRRAEMSFGYHSAMPGIRDFAITLFKSVYAAGVGETAVLTGDAVVFLKRWKDSVHYRDDFAALSAECAEILAIEQDLAERDYRQLIDLDLFELIDRQILSGLARDVAARTISADACARLVHQRRQTVWYAQYADLYEAIDAGSHFLNQLDQVTLSPYSFADGLRQYSQTWFRLDQLYRQFIYHMRQSGHRPLLAELLEIIDNYYTNKFLLPLNDRWQDIVDGVTDWRAVALPRQMDFYENYVAPYLNRGKKLFVVVSDALRYEIGEALTGRIRQEDRYEAELATAVTGLPSFTQLGMAALLPHQSLAIAEDGRTVLVDGQSSAGTANRRKILAQAAGGAGTALKAADFLNMSREESRNLFRDNAVVYIYHNRIDAAGDKRETETQVFDAVEDTLRELVLIIKKLAGANATNMIVTADHGFLYQRRPLEESDFAGQQAGGGQILTVNRRYVLGYGLTAGPGFKWFTAAAVGLDGRTEILLPKSVNRLRVKGAGSRYVHGGASLQEIVVPVIQINKKRQSDVTRVDVDILRSASSIVTTSQITIRFYQTEPVTAKVQPRVLRAGLYTRDGQLISDQHELVFDFRSNNEREREIKVQFILTRQADAAEGQEIILRLEEQMPGTSHYREYKSVRYMLRRTFGSDFDY